jgi:hypothetical protein
MGNSRFHINDVVQFTEEHKWVSCLGIVSEVKDCGDDFRYLVGVPVPGQGTAYIFTMENDDDIEYVGKAVLGEPEKKEEKNYE